MAVSFVLNGARALPFWDPDYSPSLCFRLHIYKTAGCRSTKFENTNMVKGFANRGGRLRATGGCGRRATKRPASPKDAGLFCAVMNLAPDAGYFPYAMSWSMVTNL